MPTTWEGLAASALALYGLSNELMDADRVSLFRLRDFLGDKWLENASREGHQLYWTLNNYAPWRVGWLANFVQTLDYLSKDTSLHRLLGRIKDPKEYRGAEAEVEVASRLIEAGLKVRLVPSGGDRKRTPDLSTIVNGQELLVEVTDVRPTRAYESVDRTHQEIFLSIIRRQPQSGRVCFKIYRPLSRPHLREVIGTLDKAISDFATGGHSIVQVHEEGVIDFYMFKEDAIDQLPQQARSLSMEGPDLPPVQNEIWRLPNIIESKVGQLEGQPGVIFVRDQNLMVMSLQAGFYRHLADNVCEAVYDHANLCMVGVSESFLGAPATSLVEKGRDYVLVRRGRYEQTYQDDMLIIGNRYGSFQKTSDSLIDALTASKG